MLVANDPLARKNHPENESVEPRSAFTPIARDSYAAVGAD